MKIIISCGGTGGHMFPGLAVGAELLRRGHAVTVLLSGRSVESSGSAAIPEGAGTLSVPVVPISVKRPLTLLKLASAVLRLLRAFRKDRPDAVLAMGSYTSIAPTLAARLLHIPVVLHEANAIPGDAVRKLARFATRICITFPEAAAHLPKGIPTDDTGVPLRAGFDRGIGATKADPEAFTLLVMGGSQGAADVNDAVVAALAKMRDKDPAHFSRLRVTHLAGTRNEEAVRALYKATALRGDAFRVIGFSNEMARHYAESNYCISRAGASSCFELALSGLPALFVPLPGLARDHQTFNARSMADRGAGEWKAQADLSPEWLADRLAAAMDRPDDLAKLREGLLRAARPDAAERVANSVEAAARH